VKPLPLLETKISYSLMWNYQIQLVSSSSLIISPHDVSTILIPQHFVCGVKQIPTFSLANDRHFLLLLSVLSENSGESSVLGLAPAVYVDDVMNSIFIYMRFKGIYIYKRGRICKEPSVEIQ
jgi:hypothetical protein